MARLPHEGDSVTGNKGNYVIGKFITKGPTAVMHEAIGPSGKKMFMKVYLSPTSGCDWYDDYLRYEQEINHRLESDNILAQQSVYAEDVFSAPFVTNGRLLRVPMLFQVFPFISGNINLNDLITSGIDGRQLTWNERKMIAVIFSNAMLRLHQAKIVHGDLKPENVQMKRSKTPDGSLLLTPLLVDMDGSILADRKAPWTKIDKRTGERFSGYLGTAGYFSPEHLRGEVPLLASDVFTAAIILCQILAGVHPFESAISSEGESNAYPHAAVRGKHDFLGREIPFLGPVKTDELKQLLLAALNPSHSKRPTMEALHKACVNLRKTVIIPPGETGKKVSTTTSSTTSKIGASKKEDKTLPLEPPVQPNPRRLVLRGSAGQFSTGDAIKLNNVALRRIIGEDARFVGAIPQFSLVRMPDGWYVEPEAPKNPTFLNEKKLTSRQLLHTNDVLSIGNARGRMTVSFIY